MKKRNVIYLFLFLSFTFLSGQKSFEKKEWVFKGDTLKYQILYPQKMKDGKTYPLVLFLHGSGERGDDNEKQLTHGSELFLEEKNRSKYPAIVLFPQCPKGIMWTHRMKEKTKGGDWVFNFPLENQPTKPAFLVNQLVESLLLSGKVDKQRVYVMGLSMGGIGTLEFLARWPQKYAAANVICGGHDPALAKKYGRYLSDFFMEIEMRWSHTNILMECTKCFDN